MSKQVRDMIVAEEAERTAERERALVEGNYPPDGHRSEDARQVHRSLMDATRTINRAKSVFWGELERIHRVSAGPMQATESTIKFVDFIEAALPVAVEAIKKEFGVK